MKRLRLLPILIFCAAFTLSLKVGTLWQGISAIAASSSSDSQQSGTSGTSPDPSGEPQKPANTDLGSGDEPAAPGKPPAIVHFDPSMVTDSELDLLQRLVERRAVLRKHESQLDTRQRLLQATEKRIDGKLVELKHMQETISSLLRQHDKEKEAKMRSVVKIYESMKPKDAARIFEELEMPILLDVVERMREAKAAPIMANMSPRKAKSMTASLTQRRALPSPNGNRRTKN
jgi:flagellar motility protein MotE (MotC chaperone)